MSGVVYRAQDRELNLNESNKSWRGNTQSLDAGLWVGGANIRRDKVKKNNPWPLNQVLKDGYDGIFPLIFLVGWLAKMKEAAIIFLFLSFFYDHCFIDKEDLLWEVQGKWRGYSKGSQIRLLID